MFHYCDTTVFRPFASLLFPKTCVACWVINYWYVISQIYNPCVQRHCLIYPVSITKYNSLYWHNLCNDILISENCRNSFECLLIFKDFIWILKLTQVLLTEKFNIWHVCLETRKTLFEFFRAGAKSSFLA